MQIPVHPSFGRVKNFGWVEIWVDGLWMAKKIRRGKKGEKRSFKTIDIVSYALNLKVSVNGVTCVFIVHFRSSDTFESL